MTDDGPYFGYTTGGNARLMRERWFGRHTGDDVVHYQPPEETVPYLGRTTQAVSDDDRFYDENLRDVSKHSTVEQVYHRIWGQDPDAVETLGDQWAIARNVIDDLTQRVRGIALALRYGGDGSDPDGVGWSGQGADEFLKRGPGATLKSLDDWRQFASDTEMASYMIATIIRRYRWQIHDYYWNTYVPKMNEASRTWWGWSQIYPPTIDQLASGGPELNAMRQDYIDNLREAELPLRPQAQMIQWNMAQEYWSTITQDLGGRPTVYEGPTDAIKEDPNAIAKILTPKMPSFPSAPTAPSLPDPPAIPTLPPSPGVTDPPGGGSGAPGAPGVPGEPGDPGVPGLPGAGAIPVPPTIPGLGGAGGKVPGVLRGGLGGGGTGSAPAQGAGSRPPGMPPGRPGKRTDKTTTPTGRLVEPEPEEFPGAMRGTPPPVLRRPDASATPPPRRLHPAGGGSGHVALPPPEGVAPPVVARPRPAEPEPPARRRLVPAGAGSENEFAPPAPAGPPVVGRLQPAEEPAEAVPHPSAILTGPRTSAEAGARDGVGRREVAEPPAGTAAAQEFEKIRALLLGGESAWSVVTPGGGVVASTPARAADGGDEPKAQLRSGAV